MTLGAWWRGSFLPIRLYLLFFSEGHYSGSLHFLLSRWKYTTHAHNHGICSSDNGRVLCGILLSSLNKAFTQVMSVKRESDWKDTQSESVAFIWVCPAEIESVRTEESRGRIWIGNVFVDDWPQGRDWWGRNKEAHRETGLAASVYQPCNVKCYLQSGGVGSGWMWVDSVKKRWSI